MKKPINLISAKSFSELDIRDFENGAVRDEIYYTLKYYENELLPLLENPLTNQALKSDAKNIGVCPDCGDHLVCKNCDEEH